MTAVSVVIPAYNAAATIGRTLEALAKQDLGQPFEVIVVDDGSSDRTPGLAEEAPVVTRVVYTGGRGPAAARNAGAETARAPYLAFTDADCFPQPGWLRAGIEALRTTDLVQGRVEPDPGTPMGPFDRSVWVSAQAGLFESANLFVSRGAFEQAGGFEDWLEARIGKPLAEDVWLGWRLIRSGARTAFCDAALVHHAVFRRGAGGYVGERVRLVYFPAIARKVPELRRGGFFMRIFLTPRSASFDLALTGLVTAAALSTPLPLVALAPYAWLSGRKVRPWRLRAPFVAAVNLAADAVGFAALAVGSIRRGTLLL